jgi:hypothetical protein
LQLAKEEREEKIVGQLAKEERRVGNWQIKRGRGQKGNSGQMQLRNRESAKPAPTPLASAHYQIIKSPNYQIRRKWNIQSR